MSEFIKTRTTNGHEVIIRKSSIVAVLDLMFRQDKQDVCQIQVEGGYVHIVEESAINVIDMIEFSEVPICKSIWHREDILAAFEENEEDPETLHALVDQFILEHPRLEQTMAEWLAQCGNESLATICGNWMMERDKKAGRL